MEKFLYIALFSPLISSVFLALFALVKPIKFLGYLSSGLIAVSLISTLNIFYYIYVNDIALQVVLFDWMVVGNLNLAFSFLVDHVSVVMMLVVTMVSTMVHIYSIEYMKHDDGYNRFFSYLSLFVFSMLILVMADNFAVLFIGWEGVGVCSWLLIGFWYKKEKAAWAANEAFIVNRIGDMGLMLAMFLIYWNIGSLQYDIVFKTISLLDNTTIFIIGALLFVGAMGKSAQFPLHTWLADAMEGPTPVSALIHAATMVTAGVYLVIRCHEIYDLVPILGYMIASLGAFVAIFAASMAIVNNDLKRIIAYSTLSQLGYMFVAAGLGAYWVALFHLVTHAFFKSVLFLGAGNVMHAMDNRLDIRRMGGLHSKMKLSSIIMIIASLALCGIFPLSGFFSKDKILESAFNGQFYFMWGTLIITAFLTAFYSFRLIMRVFFGKENYNNEEFDPKETGFIAIVSMIPLLVLALVSGWFEHDFEKFVTKILPTWNSSNLTNENIWILILVTSAVSITGILLAIFKYKNKKYVSYRRGAFQTLLLNQYYIPQIYKYLISKPYYYLSLFMNKYIETKVIDRTIDKIAYFAYNLGAISRVIQTGNLSSSLRLMAMGALLILLFALILASI